jgi:16S rRNA (cytosine967-C5)-methyltransferase
MNISSLIGHVLELIERVEGEPQPPDRIVSEFLRQKKYLGSHDRRFISDAVYGLIRHRRLNRSLIKQFIHEHPDAANLGAPHVRHFAAYVAYTIAIENNSSPPVHYWQTCFPKIDILQFTEWISTHRSLDYLTARIEKLGAQYSFEDWMVRQWDDLLGHETEQLLASLNTPAPVTLRVNLRKTTRDECRNRLAEEGILTSLTLLSPAGLTTNKRFNMQASATFKDGWFEMQDEGSQLISLLLNVKPGMIIIDGCAGAGGKTLHIADMLHDEGKLFAFDISAVRLKELESRANRAGLRCVTTIPPDDMNPTDFAERADVVLVDAPCTGVGTIRRNPWLKWAVTESSVNDYAEKQRTIISSHARYVKPSGTLAYATCSLFRPENEEIVEQFLSSHTDFVLIDERTRAEIFGLSSSTSFFSLYPHRHNTDGFFIALMQRLK